MGVKLNWTGLFLLTSSKLLGFPLNALDVVGAVLFLIGVILMWLDK